MSTGKLPSPPWFKYFDSLTLAKGKEYFERDKVLNFEFNNSDSLKGTVSGSSGKVYSVLIHFNKTMDGISRTSCTCPIGFDCKHTAAAVVKFLVSQNNGQKSGANNTENSNKDDHEEQELLAAPSIAISKETQTALNRLHWRHAEAKGIDFSEIEPPKGSNSRQSIVLYGLGTHVTSCRPHIAVFKTNINKDGSRGAMSEIAWEKLFGYQPASFITPEDEEIGRLWDVVSRYGTNYRSWLDSSKELFEVFIQRILKSGRCFRIGELDLMLSPGRPLPGRLEWASKDKKALWLVPVIDQGSQSTSSIAISRQAAGTPRNDASSSTAPIQANEIQVIRWTSPHYFNLFTGEFGPLKIDIDSNFMEEVLRLKINADESMMVDHILSKTGLASVIPPPPKAKKIIEILRPAIPMLRVSLFTVTRPIFERNRFTAKILAVMGESVKTLILSHNYPKEGEEISTASDGTIIVERNDPDSPKKAIRELEALGFVEVESINFGFPKTNLKCFIARDIHTWSSLTTEKLENLKSEGWEIPKEAFDLLRPVRLTDEDIRIRIEDASDSWWFSLALNIIIDGKEYSLFPILSAAIQRLGLMTTVTLENIEKLNSDGYFIAFLPNGKLLNIPFERVKPLLISLHEMLLDENKENAKVSAIHLTNLFDEKFMATAKIKASEKFIKLAKKMRGLAKFPSVNPPKDFNGTLRPYQLEGLSWLQFLKESDLGGIMADDMGLGKTIQLLAHICLIKEKGELANPFLIVCPTSVLPNWIAEARRFAPGLKVTSYTGPNRALNRKHFKDSDIVVTTYALVTRDLDFLKDHLWNCVVLDESQAIKNSQTILFDAVNQLKSVSRICMTGTPMENHLGELWSQFHFIIPGMLGTKREFNLKVRKPIEKESNDLVRRRLAKFIAPFIMRRTKLEVAPELPEKSVIIRKIELEGAQRDLYETVRLTSTKRIRDEIEAHGFKKSQIIILDALLKLRQVCCHPSLVKLTEAKKAKHSAKLDELMLMLEELQQEGRKALVFSQFTSMLNLVEVELDARAMKFVTIRGDTRDRETPVKQFQETDVPFFLLSLKAGGTGLNLTAADTVIHYDPWWNPAVEEQATDRAYRIGQDKNVFVYKLIARGTIEEKMMQLQDEKRVLAESIYSEEGGLSAWFKEEDLQLLLKPIDDDAP